MRNARRRSGKTQAGMPDTEAGAARHRTESWPAARRLGGSAARRLGGSAARRLGGSAARRLGGSADIIDGALAAIVNPLGGLFSGECSRRATAPSSTPYPPVSPLMAVSTRRRRFRPMVHARGRRLACQPALICNWYTKRGPKSTASAAASAAAAMRSPHSRCPPRRRPYPWCVSRPFGTGTRQMVHRKSRRRTPGAFGNGARRAVPHRKPRTARRTPRRFAAEHVRRYSCAEVTRSERWPRHQAVRYFHHASSVRAASPDGPGRRGRYRAPPPQTRACGIDALGSSPDRFAQGVSSLVRKSRNAAPSPVRLSTAVSCTCWWNSGLPPAFPISGSVQVTPRFPPAGPDGHGSPPSAVLSGRYDFLPLHGLRLIGFASRLRGCLSGSCPPWALPPSCRPGDGPGSGFHAGNPRSSVLARGQEQESPRFPGDPSCDSAPIHDPGRPVAPRL